MAVLPIAHWNEVPFQEVAGSFAVGVVGTHRIGLDGVVFQDAEAKTAKRRTQVITRNPRTNNFEYWKSIDCAALAAATGGAGLKTINATVYPLFPALTFLKKYAPRTLSLQLNVFAGATITYPATVYVDPVSGNDANPGTTGSPFRSIKRAVEEITAVGAQNGGRILLRAGTYAEATSPAVDCVQTTRYLHIEADTGSGASKSNIIISQWPSPNGMRCTLLHLRNVTLFSTLAGIRTSSGLATPPADRYCWLDNVDAAAAGTSSLPTAEGWVQFSGTQGFGNIYWTGGSVAACRRIQSQARLLRSIQAIGLGECKLESNKCTVNVTVSGVDPTGLSSPSPEIWSVRSAEENFLVWGLRAFGLKATPGIVLDSGGSGLPSLENVGLVNVFIEGDASSALGSSINDPSAPGWIVNHLVFEHVGIVGQPLTIVNKVRAYSFDATVLQSLTNTAGLQFDSADAPNQEWDHRGFDFMHYIDAASPSKVGRHVSTGNALFSNPASDDYRPAAGSPLFLGTHKLFRPSVPFDAGQALRGQDRTAIGPFRSLVEAPGGETAPSWATTGAAYPPGPFAGTYVVTKGLSMTPIAPVAPSGGPATRYRLLPSIDHAFRPPAEILADPDQAHFEVRPWKTGDPTKVGGAHGAWVVVDLRYGHVYLDHPKMLGQNFVPYVVAANLCAPFAADAGTYTNSTGTFAIPNGPQTTHGQRPLIRIDGDPTQNLSFGMLWTIGQATGYAGGISGVAGATNVVSWAGAPGLGGFHPFSAGASVLQGKGRLVELSIVGANLGKTDRIFIAMGGGIAPSGQPVDHTYDMGDVLFKQVQWGPANGDGGSQVKFGSKNQRSCRIRIYEGFPYSTGAQLQDGFILKWGFHTGVGSYWDVRRCIFIPFKEHGLYLECVGQGIFWGDFPDVPPGDQNSYFINNLQPAGSGRSFFQLAYRPGPCENEVFAVGSSLFSNKPGPKGISYFARNRTYGPTDGTSKFTTDGGAVASLIYDANEVHMQGARTWTPAWLGPVHDMRSARGLLFWAINNKGAYFNDFGTLCGDIAVLSHYDHVTAPDEKRLTFRGSGPVRIYDLELLKDGTGFGKPAIEINGADSGAITPANPFLTQFDKNGKWVFNETPVFDPGLCPATQPIFGTPISNEGKNGPHIQDLLLLFGYPNPSAAALWGYTASQKMVGWWHEKPPPNPKSQTDFSDSDIDLYFRGRTLEDVLCASGIVFDEATGTFSGTPTASFADGEIPFQHPSGSLATRFYVEASNGAGSTVGHVDIFVLDTSDQVIGMPIAEFVDQALPPNINISITMPIGQLVTEGLLPGAGGGSTGSGGVGSHGGPEIVIPMETAILEDVGGDPTPVIELAIEMPIAELVTESGEPEVSVFGEGSEFDGAQGDVPAYGGADGIGL